MIRIAAGDLGRIFSEGGKWGELELNTFRAGVGEEGLLQRSQGVGGPAIKGSLWATAVGETAAAGVRHP